MLSFILANVFVSLVFVVLLVGAWKSFVLGYDLLENSESPGFYFAFLGITLLCLTVLVLIPSTDAMVSWILSG
tara:strand:- start:133 stop:351 length:219 start_codon:yes stop_codon:yes gene_type:complete